MDAPSLTPEETAVYDELRRRTVLVDLPAVPDPLMQFMLENFARITVLCRRDSIPFAWVREKFIGPIIEMAEKTMLNEADPEFETWRAIWARLSEAAEEIATSEDAR